MNSVFRLSKPPDPGRRHLIEEYRHKARTVTCTCGWHGSTLDRLDAPSEWAAHVREHRGTTF